MQTESLSGDDSDAIATAILESTGAADSDMSRDEIGPSWGAEVAERSGIGLGVFLILVSLFIWAYFREWKMSVGGLVALAHDVVITIGVYAISGFQVTPASVTALLTILGFSLYDTVVVFDKVRENTKDLQGYALDVRPSREPRGQPDPGPLDQHLDRGADPGRGDLVGQRRAARCELVEGPVPGPVRRYGGRPVLLGVHRDAAGGPPQAERDRRPAGRAAGEGAGEESRRRPLRRGAGVRRGPAGERRGRRGRRGAGGGSAGLRVGGPAGSDRCDRSRAYRARGPASRAGEPRPAVVSSRRGSRSPSVRSSP